MHLNNTLRNKLREKAELFYNYLYEQFSDPSDYITHISRSYDQAFDIDFKGNRVHTLFLKIDTL